MVGTPTQEEIQAAQAREAAGAAAAAEENLRWRSVNDPGSITPAEAATAERYRQEYYQQQVQQAQLMQQQQQFADADAQAEYEKHQAAFHAADNLNMGAMADVPLSVIASVYGEAAADKVQQYYTDHPSARFLSIVAGYADQQSRTITGDGFYSQGSFQPWDPSEAAGGPVITGRAADYAASWTPLSISQFAFQNDPNIERTEIVPIPTTGYMQTWNGRTFFVPYGERTQQELLDAKAVFDPIGGRVGFYQVPASIYEQAGGFHRIYGWETASGSTGALQSGMFSVGKPLTPDVRTQWSPDTYSPSANVEEAVRVRMNPAAFSRMGAEAYGGVVSLLDNRTLSPETLMGRYPASTGNLANLVDPFGVNLPKSQLQAVEPWRISGDSPILQTMSGAGFSGTKLSPLPISEYIKVGMGDRLIGGNTLAGDFGYESGGIPKPFKSTSGSPGNITTRIEAQHFELPFVGEVPVISPFVEMFLPEKIITTKTTTTQNPDIITQKPPYTIGDTTFFETITTSGMTVNKEESTTFGLTPFTKMMQGFLPEGKKKEEEGWYLFDNPIAAGAVFSLMGSKPQDSWLLAPKAGERLWKEQIEGPLKFGQSLLPGSTEWRKQTYENIREDPALGLVSAGITLAFVGAGTGARSLGAGTTWLKAGTKGQVAYSTLSTVATAGMVAVYGNDVLRRTTGMQIGDVTSSVFVERNPAGILDKMRKNWVGWETATKQTNRVITQELGPMYAVNALVSPIGFRISDWATTRGKPELKDITRMAYTSEEGFATNAGIRTGDLVDSFLSGTLTMRNPAALSRTKMAPDMGPLNRIPVGTQTGASPGKSYIFSGAEYPHLTPGGMVGESFSEVTQAMYTSPVGYSYFTKPGAGQGGLGFGITNDIFGLYSRPTLFRLEVNEGDYQLIPRNLMNVPTEGKSINDPMNPRTIAISEWMARAGEYGKPIIGQYGKSEWQYLIRTGTSVKSSEPVGWFRDAGRRVMLQDAVFGGKAKGYEPRTQFEVGRFFAGTPAESSISSGIARSGYPMVSPAISTVISSGWKMPEIVSSSVVSSRSRISISSMLSRSGISRSSKISSPFSSTRGSSIRYPSYNLYPSSMRYPSSSRQSSKSESPFSTRSSSRSSITSTPRITVTTTPSITTTTTPFHSTTSTPYTDRTIWTDTITTTTKIPGWGGLPGGGSRSDARRPGTWTLKFVNPVGADLIGATKGNRFNPDEIFGGKGKKKKGLPKFRMPKF